MARWIFQFRSTGKRPLSEAERVSLERDIRRIRTGRTVKKVASWGIFAIGLWSFWAALQVAAGYGMATLIIALIGFAVGSTDFDSERRALLYERLLRIGEVERFERVEGDGTVRELWSLPVRPSAFERREAEDEDELKEEFWPQETPIWGVFWEAEERFEKSLEKLAGRRPDWFETASDDGAIVFVEGVRPDSFLDARIWKAH